MAEGGWVPTPARGYSWPPFEKGNLAHVTHGARSERLVAARAAEIHGELLAVAPWLDEEPFLPAVDRYLKAAAREALLHDFITSLAAEKGPGAVPSRTWEQCTAASRLASKLGSELGLDPLGHARIVALNASAYRTAALRDLVSKGAALRRDALEPGAAS